MGWVLEPEGTTQAAEASVAAARAKVDPALLSAAKPSAWVLEPEAPAADAPSIGGLAVQALKNRGAEVMAAPGRLVSKAGEVIAGIPSAVSKVATQPLDFKPKPSTALPLSLPGGGTVLTRIAAAAGGKVLEDPQPTPAGNAQVLAKGAFGDPTGDKPLLDKILSVGTAPATLEALVPFLGWGARVSPGGKARINEGQSREFVDALGRMNRVAREAVEAAPVSPLQKEPRTAATIKRGFESGAVEKAAGDRFGGVLAKVDAAAGNPTFSGPRLQEGYAMMPPTEQRLLGPVGPNGFTLQQAQEIRSWVADPAFAQSTLGQGVRKTPQQRLVGEITQEMEQGLAHAPRALQVWRANNRAYASTEAVQEAMTQGHAFRGQPNRTFLDRSALSEYFARNEKDLVARMGREGYEDFVNRVLGGAQPGTRDIVAPGSGTPASQLMAWLRGANTGTTQTARLPLTVGAPNIGSQYTGRTPYTLPPALQAILDVGLQKLGGAALSGDRR